MTLKNIAIVFILFAGLASCDQASKEKAKKRELRYLFFANGGIVGYFDDGTIAGCPRCDFCKSNIVAMFNEKTYGKYKVENDGSLTINGDEHLVPAFNPGDIDGWALIDYKWKIKPPQY